MRLALVLLVVSCNMTLHVEDEGIRAQEIKDIVVVKFNLNNIDPSSIKVKGHTHYGGLSCDGTEDQTIADCDHAELVFKTHNEAGLISEDRRIIFQKLTGNSHQLRSVKQISDSYFEISDLAYAKRFAKAFAHAVELCGGKRSAF
jgi:hypothetical protein